jgi:hypothetical protein
LLLEILIFFTVAAGLTTLVCLVPGAPAWPWPAAAPLGLALLAASGLITALARAHRNAIIFAGTMGLIRLSVLQRVGGWNAECVTEDAECSLRMLGLGEGLVGVYDPRPWGAGMMPLNFDGLKKQRFRWALGGIQIPRPRGRRRPTPVRRRSEPSAE